MSFFHFIKYRLVRPIVAWLAWHFHVKFFYQKIHRAKSGEPLKKGIAAIVPVFNEEYHLQIVLESIVGIADQVIILDNGSTDHSAEIALQFEKKYSGICTIEILSLPLKSLAEALNAGLERVQHEWLLRWDGDFINFDKSRFLELKSKLDTNGRPTAFRLPYINLCSDYDHYFTPAGAIYPGEFYLRSFNRNLQYTLVNGRLEVCIIPLYFRLVEEKLPYIIHLGHVKPIERILHRHVYMDWVDTVHNFPALRNRYETIDSFRNDWIKNVLRSGNINSAKFRFSRLMAVQCGPLDDSLKNSFPAVLNDFIKTHDQRFTLLDENGKPYRVIDNADEALRKYAPSKDDLEWLPDIEKFYSREARLQFVLNPTKK